MSELSAAIQRFDVIAYLQARGANSKRTNEWTLDCPSCGKRKLTVNVQKRNWHCWICQRYEVRVGVRGPRRVPVAGAGGLLSLVQVLDRVDRATAAQLVLRGMHRASGLSILSPGDLREAVTECGRRDLPTMGLPEGACPVEASLPYLIRRGITVSSVHEYGLFECGVGRYSGRVVFPVWAEDGRLLYWQARATWAPGPRSRYVKVLNPTRWCAAGDDCGRCPGCAEATPDVVLGNLWRARQHDRVALVEGPVDAVRTGTDAVWTFGKRITYRQIALLLRAGVRAVDLMWDGPTRREPGGAWAEMLDAAVMLAPLFDLRLVFLPWGDPGDHRTEDLDAYRAASFSYPTSSLAVIA